MKAFKLITTFIFALLISTAIASAYIYSYGEYNPYYARSSYGGYGNSYSAVGGYNNYGGYYGSYGYGYGRSSSFNYGGYMPYTHTYGYYYGGDPYWKYAVLDYFASSSPSR